MTSSDCDYRERLVSRTPVTVRRRVQWGECDPARVVYTPRFADYAASAYDWFSNVVLDGAGFQPERDLVLAPAKHLSLTFHRPLVANEWFEMVVRVDAIRRHSYDLAIEGTGDDRTPRFSAQVSPIFVSATSFDKTVIPESVRHRLEDYHARFGCDRP